MLQEYFNNSIEQSFLKALLSAVQLPKFKIVKKNDLIFENYFYIYNGKIIKCTSTGYLDPQNLSVQDFVLGEDSINYLSKAQYEVLSHYNPSTEDQNIEFKEFIRASYYSTELHKRFGEYLRFLRDYYNVDLMGMYNCFSYEVFSNLHIASKITDFELELFLKYEQNPAKKVLAIPVKFNSKYTIAVTSDQPVYCAFVAKFSNKIRKLSAISTVSNEKMSKPFSLGLTKFEQPVVVDTSLSLEDDDVYKYNDKLYLILQLDKLNTSSLVVLEGDYTNSYAMNIVSSEFSSVTDTVSLCYKPSLLSFNSGIQFAYSNTLIPYLVKNVIDNIDTTPGNITYAKQLLSMSDDLNYWKNDIKYLSYDKYLFDTFIFEKDDDGYNIQPSSINSENNDVTGYIDSTIERWLNAKQ